MSDVSKKIQGKSLQDLPKTFLFLLIRFPQESERTRGSEPHESGGRQGGWERQKKEKRQNW